MKRFLVSLAAVALLGLRPVWAQDNKAALRSTEAWARLARIQVLLEYFYMETGLYPLSLEELEKVINSQAPRGTRPLQLPTDPATGQSFKYSLDKSGRKYVLTVPDPTRYGGQIPTLAPVDWGFLADIAERRRFEQITVQCGQILKALATQCEMYAKDHARQYPNSLDDLLPRYIPRHPTDPITGKNFAYKKLVDGYTISCPNPEKYGLKVFQYSSSTGMQIEQLQSGTSANGTAPAPAPTPTPAPAPDPSPSQ